MAHRTQDKHWQAQNQHYCAVCKLYLANNPQAIAVHEQGFKHRQRQQEQQKQKRIERQQQNEQDREVQQQLREIEREAARVHREKDGQQQHYQHSERPHPHPPNYREYRPIHAQQPGFHQPQQLYGQQHPAQHPSQTYTPPSTAPIDVHSSSDDVSQPPGLGTGANVTDEQTEQTEQPDSEEQSPAAESEDDDDFLARMSWKQSDEQVLTADTTDQIPSAEADAVGKKRRKFHNNGVDSDSIQLTTSFTDEQQAAAHDGAADSDDEDAQSRAAARRRARDAIAGTVAQQAVQLPASSIHTNVAVANKPNTSILFKKRLARPTGNKLAAVFDTS